MRAPVAVPFFSSLLTSNLSKSDQLLTKHRSPSTHNRDSVAVPLPSEEGPTRDCMVLNLKAGTRFWSWLSLMCQTRSTAVPLRASCHCKSVFVGFASDFLWYSTAVLSARSWIAEPPSHYVFRGAQEPDMELKGMHRGTSLIRNSPPP